MREVLLLNRHFSLDGEIREFCLARDESKYLMQFSLNGVVQSETRSESKAEALEREPRICEIGTGATILQMPDQDIEEFLQQAVVIDPDAEMAEIEEIENVMGGAFDEFLEDDSVFTRIEVEGLTLRARPISINSTWRGAIAQQDGQSWLFVYDPNAGEPPPMQFAYRWDFYQESGGPCSWDGSCQAGIQGNRIFLEFETGDNNPGLRLKLLDENVAKWIATQLVDADVACAFMRSVLGFACLTEGERSRLPWGIDGTTAMSAMSTDLDDEIIRHCVKLEPELATAKEALIDPQSQQGKLLHKYLEALISDAELRIDWNDIDEVLMGRRRHAPSED